MLTIFVSVVAFGLGVYFGVRANQKANELSLLSIDQEDESKWLA